MNRARLRAAALICLLLLPLVFLSCANTGDVLPGRWETKFENKELGSLSMVYHFTEEGEIFIQQKQGYTIPFCIPLGTWAARGDRVTISSDGGENTFTFSVNGDELTLSEEGGETMVFHRI